MHNAYSIMVFYYFVYYYIRQVKAVNTHWPNVSHLSQLSVYVYIP